MGLGVVLRVLGRPVWPERRRGGAGRGGEGPRRILGPRRLCVVTSVFVPSETETCRSLLIPAAMRSEFTS